MPFNRTGLKAGYSSIQSFLVINQDPLRKINKKDYYGQQPAESYGEKLIVKIMQARVERPYC